MQRRVPEKLSWNAQPLSRMLSLLGSSSRITLRPVEPAPVCRADFARIDADGVTADDVVCLDNRPLVHDHVLEQVADRAWGVFDEVGADPGEVVDEAALVAFEVHSAGLEPGGVLAGETPRQDDEVHLSWQVLAPALDVVLGDLGDVAHVDGVGPALPGDRPQRGVDFAVEARHDYDGASLERQPCAVEASECLE
eukprot:596646-Heterocapsa_arctica.AAC.1